MYIPYKKIQNLAKKNFSHLLAIRGRQIIFPTPLAIGSSTTKTAMQFLLCTSELHCRLHKATGVSSSALSTSGSKYPDLYFAILDEHRILISATSVVKHDPAYLRISCHPHAMLSQITVSQFYYGHTTSAAVREEKSICRLLTTSCSIARL